MKKWIQDNPWIALLVALMVGALFFAAPIALLVVKVKEFFQHKNAPATGGKNPQEQVASKANG